MQRRDFMAGLIATPTAPVLTSLLSGVKSASGVAAPVTTAAVPQKKNFVSWECMRWNNGPSSLATCGLRRMPIYYQNSLITGEDPDFRKLDKVIASIKANRQQLVTLDLEHWNAASRPDREKLIRTIEYVRARVPATTKLAYYGIMPKPRYRDYVAGGARLTYQQQNNRLMKPLADKVDWIMPMFHAYSTNRREWAKFAEVTMAEARQYGKPVMPWVWPQFHDLSPNKAIRYQLIPGDFFRQQLDTAYRLADSVCIWASLKPLPSGANGRATWLPQAPWWGQTKAFLHSHGQNLATCRA
jgi:hypothetical protein